MSLVAHPPANNASNPRSDPQVKMSRLPVTPVYLQILCRGETSGIRWRPEKGKCDLQADDGGSPQGNLSPAVFLDRRPPPGRQGIARPLPRLLVHPDHHA